MSETISALRSSSTSLRQCSHRAAMVRSSLLLERIFPRRQPAQRDFSTQDRVQPSSCCRARACLTSGGRYAAPRAFRLRQTQSRWIQSFQDKRTRSRVGVSYPGSLSQLHGLCKLTRYPRELVNLPDIVSDPHGRRRRLLLLRSIRKDPHGANANSGTCPRRGSA